LVTVMLATDMADSLAIGGAAFFLEALVPHRDPPPSCRT
jgi:hypothetical protein